MLSSNKIYLIITSSAFAIATAALNLLPRSSVSERERRSLAEFPKFSIQKMMSGQFTDSISKWYSDTEPFRDILLGASDYIRRARGIHPDSEVSIVAGADLLPEIEDLAAECLPEKRDTAAKDCIQEPYDTLAQSYKPSSNGIIITGKEPCARAMFGFTSTSAYVETYASAANAYKEAFPEAHIWVMPVPTSVEFYCPQKAKSRMQPQKKIIDKLFSYLNPGVCGVDIWQTLKDHAHEPIYLRTDHHWSQLGGFYAAKQLAEAAGLPFLSLSDGYEERVVRDFVGSLYAYSSDISVKNSPEDFVWYWPCKANFETYYISYTLDDSRRITGESKEHRGKYFSIFKDGSGGAYCTFMGSDSRITRVATGVNNGRRIVILKDSFGNTVPSCLFYSFEEVHVVDYRYFSKNMKQYAQDHRITDFLFCNNMNFVTNPNIGRIYKRFLNQSGINLASGGGAEAARDTAISHGPKPAVDDEAGHEAADSNALGASNQQP